ncbi:hypothetical protein NBH00_21415 [Paraconexibacter antarcticus]|uniref:Uncharacterized protein n=1 Tax=Paraconexibacter antarcticus TaxID=2949664 RepID=A0ABY5DPC5_9ACTN|nr:hypothetical protein [Paraconexibacter antarcticus]UTI63890.1 hypothetical protein NBH00_21415 [Paraconexibacter antarcticus]
MRRTNTTTSPAEIRDFVRQLEQEHPDLTKRELAQLTSGRYLIPVGRWAWARARLRASAPDGELPCGGAHSEDLLREMVLTIATISGRDPAGPARSAEVAALLSLASRETESVRRDATDLVARFIVDGWASMAPPRTPAGPARPYVEATVEGAVYGLMAWTIAREAIGFYGLTGDASWPVQAGTHARLVTRRAEADPASGA